MRKRVIESLETPEGDRCVDIFSRDDGSFGFEIYRRDVEALSGWFPIGGHVERVFEKQSLAHAAAAEIAPWINAE